MLCRILFEMHLSSNTLLSILVFTLDFYILTADEFCNWEIFQPRCSNNEIIVIERAVFGRKTMGRCLLAEGVSANNHPDDPQFLGCYADVKNHLEEQCAVKKQCDVAVAKIEMETNCHKWLKFHLEIEYSCLPVVQDTRHCSINLAHGKQFISGKEFTKGTCGSKNHPWNIESMTGQKIVINVINVFQLSTEHMKVHFRKSNLDQENMCTSLGLIKETRNKHHISLCLAKESTLPFNNETFTTDSNTIEVELENSKNASLGFVLSLEAVGCSDLIPPADAWLKRTENEATIGCYSTRLRWQLKCVGQRWIGVIGNCSHGHRMDGFVTKAIEPVSKSQDQIIPIVTIAVAGFVICFFIVCVGTVFMNRYYALSKARMMKQTIGIYKNGIGGSVYDDSNGKYDLDTMNNENGNIMQFNKATNNFNDPAKYYELDQTVICKEFSS